MIDVRLALFEQGDALIGSARVGAVGYAPRHYRVELRGYQATAARVGWRLVRQLQRRAVGK